MIVLLSSGNCILFLFIISPSSLVFLIWFDITLLVSFSSLFMVSFSWFTFKIVAVTPLTNNSNIWPSPGIVSLDSLLPVTGPYFSISFYVLYFLLRSGYSEYHVVVTLWKSNTSTHQGLLSFLCWWLEPSFCSFSILFFAKYVFFVVYVHWSFSSVVSTVSQCTDRDFLKWLSKEKKTYLFKLMSRKPISPWVETMAHLHGCCSFIKSEPTTPSFEGQSPYDPLWVQHATPGMCVGCCFHSCQLQGLRLRNR